MSQASLDREPLDELVQLRLEVRGLARLEALELDGARRRRSVRLSAKSGCSCVPVASASAE